MLLESIKSSCNIEIVIPDVVNKYIHVDLEDKLDSLQSNLKEKEQDRIFVIN